MLHMKFLMILMVGLNFFTLLQCTRKLGIDLYSFLLPLTMCWPFQVGALARARHLEAFRRAEKYAIFYRRKAKQEVRLNRVARAEGRVRVPGEARLAFVMRTKG